MEEIYRFKNKELSIAQGSVVEDPFRLACCLLWMIRDPVQQKARKRCSNENDLFIVLDTPKHDRIYRARAGGIVHLGVRNGILWGIRAHRGRSMADSDF
jgi:hypothetical protein